MSSPMEWNGVIPSAVPESVEDCESPETVVDADTGEILYEPGDE